MLARTNCNYYLIKYYELENNNVKIVNDLLKLHFTHHMPTFRYKSRYERALHDF